MYPEAIDQNTSIPPTQCLGQQTAVQRLTEPAQVLKNAVINLINYQDVADSATKALPELLRLLEDNDNATVAHAAMIVNQFSKKEASRHALSNSTQLIKTLLQTIEHSSDPETTKIVSEVLNNIADNSQGLLAIFKTGGIRSLIQALSSPVEMVVFYALSTLHKLLLHQEGAKMNVRLNGGLQRLVMLLQRDSHKFLTLVTDCLHILAYGNQEGKLIILASGGPAELVRILHSYNYEKLLFTTARVIKVLSVCPSNKPALIQSGGIQTLALRLNSHSFRLTQECLWALRNLSDATTKEQNVETLLQILIQLLESNDVNIVTCTVGILSNMTCNNQSNKSFICRIGGVVSLLSTLAKADKREEILEPTICALRHLTDQHQDATIAQETIRANNSIQEIAKILDLNSGWPLLTALVGLVKNLAYDRQNLAILKDFEIVQKLSSLLNKAWQLYQDSFETSDTIAGSKYEKVTEIILCTLLVMANDNQVNMIISNISMITILISLLYKEQESIVTASMDLLIHMAQDPTTAATIESQGALQPLSNLLLSPNEQISQRGALLFSLISSDKSPEYTQRLSNEINTLFQNENPSNLWHNNQNHDTPAIYTMEDNNGIIAGHPSAQSPGSRQNIYSSYLPQQVQVDVSNYVQSNQVHQIMQNSNDANISHDFQLSTEPWYDTDL